MSSYFALGRAATRRVGPLVRCEAREAFPACSAGDCTRIAGRVIASETRRDGEKRLLGDVCASGGVEEVEQIIQVAYIKRRDMKNLAIVGC